MIRLGIHQRETLKRFISEEIGGWVPFKPSRGLKPWPVMRRLIELGLLEVRWSPSPSNSLQSRTTDAGKAALPTMED